MGPLSLKSHGRLAHQFSYDTLHFGARKCTLILETVIEYCIRPATFEISLSKDGSDMTSVGYIDVAAFGKQLKSTRLRFEVYGVRFEFKVWGFWFRARFVFHFLCSFQATRQKPLTGT